MLNENGIICVTYQRRRFFPKEWALEAAGRTALEALARVLVQVPGHVAFSFVATAHSELEGLTPMQGVLGAMREQTIQVATAFARGHRDR